MASWDLIKHLERQRDFSLRTFGPGARTAGVSDHIRKELKEIEAKPDDLMEWVDVILLAFDGAWRAGHDPVAIAAAITHKQGRNESRVWPDWRTADPNKAIEHDRAAQETFACLGGCGAPVPAKDAYCSACFQAMRRKAKETSVPQCPRGQCPWSGCDCGQV